MKTLLSAFLLLISSSGFAQQQQDSTKTLKEVKIRPYFSLQPLLRSTGAIGLLDQSVLDKQGSSSLVSAMNTISGLRMEERSPGSYRLSIRGSLLRSPFGIRNVKIYFDDFPLTDAGGNSYLNALDIAAAERIQVLKGPQGSTFGANSGGVVLIQPRGTATDSTIAALRLEGGSFGTFRQNLNLDQQFKKYSLSITQSYQRSDGYRDHSAMDRKYFQVLQKWDYAKTSNLKALIFYSDLHYNTPGGLNAAQYEANPKASRPAAGAIKSAIQQQAGIFSKTLYGGVSNEWQISPHTKHVASVFSSYTDFKNPFITNYEHRKEFTFGVRTYLEYAKSSRTTDLKFNYGLESMQTSTDITNHDNNLGKPAALQASDRLEASSNFAFVNLNIDLIKKWLLELSASANMYQYAYKRIAPVATNENTKHFNVQLMPRAALSYLINTNLSLRASVSKGYSPPTTAEVRASDNVINVDLQPESGWNYETGIRYQGFNNRVLIDVTGFYYHLKNAIVRRLNDNNTEYFINAGGTKQLGLETTLSYWIVPMQQSGLVRGLQLRNAYTLSRFKFENYSDKGVDFSKNDLTGVPKNIVVSSADLQLPGRYYLFLQHNYTSSIPLNDANTDYAKKYHLVQAKIGWKSKAIGRFPLEFFVSADNLLDQKYSLGNDLNAVGGRYFNAAAGRNFYGGMVVRFNKQ